MNLTAAQLATWFPPPCLRCGALPEVDWVDVSTWGDAEPTYVPGLTTCPTSGCVDEHGSRQVPLERCPICHRPPGDIHEGRCAPIVLARKKRGEMEPCRIGHDDATVKPPSPTPRGSGASGAHGSCYARSPSAFRRRA